jgi:hypothetical protein
MTERKPLGMKFSSWVDQQIEQARRKGAFDDLPGEGRRDPNLEASRDPEWWGKSLMKREGVSVLPASLELRRFVEQELEDIETVSEEDEVRLRIQRVNERIRKMNSRGTTGPPSNLGPLDEDEVVGRWRARRASEPGT